MLGCTRNHARNTENEMGIGIPYEIQNISGSTSVVTLVKNQNTIGILYEFQIGMIDSEKRILYFDKPIKAVHINNNRITVTWDGYGPFAQPSKNLDINTEIQTVFAVTRRNEIIKIDYTTLRDVVE